MTDTRHTDYIAARRAELARRDRRTRNAALVFALGVALATALGSSLGIYAAVALYMVAAVAGVFTFALGARR